MYTTKFFQTQSINKTVSLLKNILIASNDGLCVCDLNGYILLYNEAYLQITGISADLLNKYNAFQLVKLNLVPNGAAAVALQTESTYSTIIDYHNGKKSVVTATPFLQSKQELSFVVSNVRDITKMNHLQTELEETRQINSVYRKKLEQIENDQQLVYRSKSMSDIVSLATRFSKNDAPLLLLGETGVGKDVLANYIHKHGERSTKPMIKINCGAIPGHLLESELFGYEKGAFTGANRTKEGLFELAHEGTIFLDEVGDLPYELQVKLLNVLQDSKIRRLGGSRTHHVNIRIIAATNSDLESLVAQKKFRPDLYYRLNVLSITIPPLRVRREDIPALLFCSLEKLEQKYKTKKRIDNNTLEKFMEYNWPGNIRELNNTLERLYHMSEDSIISMDESPSTIRSPKMLQVQEIDTINHDDLLPLKQVVAEFEKKYIMNALSCTPTMQECADKLRINISTLVRKKRTLGIK